MFSHRNWGDLLGNKFLFRTEYKTQTGGLDIVPSKDKGIKGKSLAHVRFRVGHKNLIEMAVNSMKRCVLSNSSFKKKAA